MIILREKSFSRERWTTKRPKTILGWLSGRGRFAENNRVLEYNREHGRKWWKPVWRFGSRWRDFKRWQKEKYGNTIYGRVKN